MGASTWALGSHRWRPYRGIFTMNAIIHANHRRVLDQELGRGWAQSWIIRKFNVPILFWINSRATSRGKDPTRV